MMNLQHPLGFFQSLASQGRADLAALNAARDGRLRLAIYYHRMDGLNPYMAWRLTWRQYRECRAESTAR